MSITQSIVQYLEQVPNGTQIKSSDVEIGLRQQAEARGVFHNPSTYGRKFRRLRQLHRQSDGRIALPGGIVLEPLPLYAEGTWIVHRDSPSSSSVHQPTATTS